MSDFWSAVVASLLGAVVGGAATAGAARFEMRRTARLTEMEIAATAETQRRFLWLTEMRNSLGAVTEVLGAISEVCDEVTTDHRRRADHGPITQAQDNRLTGAWRRAQRVSTIHAAFIPSTITEGLDSVLDDLDRNWCELFNTSSDESYACCALDLELGRIADRAYDLQSAITNTLADELEV